MNAIVQRYLLKYPGRVLILVLLASLIFHTTINVFRLQWSASWLTTPISGGLEKWEKELDGGLGILEFPAPRDTRQEVYAHFVLGLKAMSCFWYDLAEEQFQKVQRLDPDFALGYWGEALCSYKFLWKERPHLKKGRGVIKKLGMRQLILNRREWVYFESVKILLGYGSLGSKVQVLEYSEYLQNSSSLFPEDDFLACMYAASLMDFSLSSHASPEVIEARGILTSVLSRSPSHAYALHLMLHALDFQETASQALVYANRYSQYVTMASHGSHMPCHIYVRLGMWRKAVHSEKLALEAGDRFAKQRKNGSFLYDYINRYHSLEWLQFYLLQLGRYKEAQSLLDRVQSVVFPGHPVQLMPYYYRMVARQWLETREFNRRTLPFPKPLYDLIYWSSISESAYLLASGLSQLQTTGSEEHNDTAVIEMVKRMDKIADNTRTVSKHNSEMVMVMKYELMAASEFSKGPRHHTKAFNIMDKALQVQENMTWVSYSPNLEFTSAWSFYGDLIVSSGVTQPRWLHRAIELFKKDLKKQPQNAASTIGLARAYYLQGDCSSASKWYSKVKQQWEDADTQFPARKTLVKINMKKSTSCSIAG